MRDNINLKPDDLTFGLFCFVRETDLKPGFKDLSIYVSRFVYFIVACHTHLTQLTGQCFSYSIFSG